MNFQHFVKKSTKGLFVFIVISMVVPLVLWGYMSGGGGEEEEGGEAGKIFGDISISNAEFKRQQGRAVASWWWKKYHDPRTQMEMQYYRRMPAPPKPEEVTKQAWEDIVLLEDARQKGITATEKEGATQVQKVYQMFTGSYDIQAERLHMVARDYFHVGTPLFEAWAQDQVVIEKLLNLVSEASFADYDRVYDQILRQQQLAKVWYAPLDPKDYVRDVKTPRTEEIASYYQKNKDKFKVPGKVQVAYLMADFDELKKKIAEPTEAEIKKYYEDNAKAEFAKPHEEHKHAPGEEHKEDEPAQVKPFEEVKAEIPSRIKQKAAEKEANAIMDKVDVELGAIASANGDKYPADVFDQLKKRFKDKQIELVHDITVNFDRKQVDDIETTVGKSSNLGIWAFDSAQKVGDVSQKVKTTKGVALFRVQQKKDAYEPGITDRTRETIIKELQKEQLKRRTQTVASNVVQEITTNGMAAARRKYALDWRVTRYFKPGGGDYGIEDGALANQISSQISQNQLHPGKASVLPGMMLRSRDKADWAYVLYLEDLVDGVPEEVSTQFATSRRGLDEQSRRQYREEYVSLVVAGAKPPTIDPTKKSAAPDAPKP